MLDTGKELLRRWFAKIWQVRGGGLYAVGWAATFVYLEVRTLIGEFIEADSFADFVTEQLMEKVLRFMMESVMNMVQAFMWPIDIIQWNPPYGPILLVIAFVLFPIYAKPHITKWLFPDGEPSKEGQATDDEESEPGSAQRK